jgi:tagatose 1,6-diphosphate aldolase
MTTHGKFRHLSRCTTPDGHFVVLAIDHRANLRAALDRRVPTPITDAEFAVFKQAILKAGAPEVSAVLTDPAYGIGAGIAERTIPGQVGLLAPLEVTNYDIPPDQGEIDFIPHWSVERIQRVSGDGVKLLLYYHPDSIHAAARRAVVAQVVEDCARYDIPFFLEPITYSLDPAKPLSNAELLAITVEMAQTFSAMGVDILKLHFPIDPAQNDNNADWLTACVAVNEAATVPWALLSAGVTFEMFMRQARIACQAGASGVIVGRAVWNEAITLHGQERDEFIRTTAVYRLRALRTLCEEFAQPWYARITSPSSAGDWYEKKDF